jgi:hypothetical protein
MDNVQKTLLQIITHHRQNPLDFNWFTSFSLFEMHKLITVFQFTSQFLLIRAPSSRKPIVVPVGKKGKLIFILRVFALRAVLAERIKLVNRGIRVQDKGQMILLQVKRHGAVRKVRGLTTQPDSTRKSYNAPIMRGRC